ncbi:MULTISPECIES: hypothetical protein [unclassified Streptomyces]|uniref:hypothetical protein n=1 Tax=unclassified Streptomyces TaxID=2593676 RepID=UPI0033B30962
MAVGAVAGFTALQAMERLMNPELRGQTPEYVDELAKKAGMSSAPMNPTAATGGKGTRYFVPGDPDVMLFLNLSKESLALIGKALHLARGYDEAA